MSAYFFDSSAIVKRYVNEIGSDWVESTLTASDDVYIAAITGVEVISAFARQLKGNRLTLVDAGTAISNFHDDFANQFLKVRIGDAVIIRSMALAEAHALGVMTPFNLERRLK